MTKPVVIISVGAEGGSITLFGQQDADGDWQFVRTLNDQTPTFLDAEDGGPAISHASPCVDTWSAAVALMDEYPWASLFGLEVHPDFRNRVWQEVERRLLIVPEPYAEDARQRWARACGIANVVEGPSS